MIVYNEKHPDTNIINLGVLGTSVELIKNIIANTFIEKNTTSHFLL